MTVSSTTTKNSYSGDGSTTTFAYAFKIFADADLTVILRSSTGTETVQSLTTNYTVTNAGNANGGNVVFGTAPASGVTVVIRRNMAQTQSTDYVANDPFPAATHEDALDRLTFIDQQQQEEVDRSIKLSRTNTMTSTEFTVGATDRANKVLAFDGNGELSVTQELGTYKGTDATVTTEAYVVRDIIKSTTTAQLNNVYICVANAVVGDSLTDTDHFELLVDAVSAATSATNAANSASAASTSETNAATSASTATTQASNASTSASTASTQATNAANSATAASNAQAAAEAALDTFDDRFLGAKASDPTVDNDGNALIDGALYFDTTNDIMKVYDLTNTTWRQLTLTSSNQTNVNTVAGQISPTNNIATVAGADTNIGLVAGSISNVNTTASNIANVNSVAGNESNINSAVSNESNINAVVSNASNINSVAGNSTNINSVAGSITNVNTVATNISSVNNFADVYRIASSAPTTSLDVGDLYFDTTSDTLKVYGASGWQSAGSSINGTSQRYHYDISGTPTSVTGADANGNTLTYDAGYVDVYVNGVRMSQADITVTSGDTVTFTEALANGDEVDIVGYGTFSVASLNADNLDSGTVPDARITGAYTSITNLTMSGNLTVDTNTLYVDSANNRVGIGETSPLGKLHIRSSDASITSVNANADDLIIENNGNCGISIASSTTGEGNLNFIDSGDTNIGRIQYSHSDNHMHFRVNDAERMRIDSGGRVGIGVVPNTGWSNTWDVAQVGLTGSLSSIASGSLGRTFVSDNAYNDAASQVTTWQYQIADQASQLALIDGKLEFRVATAGSADADITWNQAVTVDNSGNLLVGKTSTSTSVVGSAMYNYGTIGATRDGSHALDLGRNTSDGYIAIFRKDGTTVGNIGTSNGDLYIGTGDTGLRFHDGDNSIYSVNATTGAKINGAIDLGESAGRFKDLYLSGGVYLGGTGSANLLDDYETGIWFPTVSQGTVTSVRSSYIKIGKRVTISAELNTFSNRTNSGSIEIQSLPFTQDTAKDRVCIGTAMWQYVDQENNAVFNATNGLQFYKSQSGAFDSLRYNDLNNSLTTVYFFATYVTT